MGSFGKASGNIAYAQEPKSQIQITAYVPEHISFKIVSGKIDISTNRDEGLWVLSEDKSLSGNLFELEIENDRSPSDIIITPKI